MFQGWGWVVDVVLLRTDRVPRSPQKSCSWGIPLDRNRVSILGPVINFCVKERFHGLKVIYGSINAFILNIKYFLKKIMYNIGTVLARYMPQKYHNCSCQKKWYIYICFQIFFVGANCTAHPERLIQTTHLQRRIFIYCLSSNYCMPFPSQHPPLKGLCVCASVICFPCVWGQVFGTWSYLQQGPADRTSLHSPVMLSW